MKFLVTFFIFTSVLTLIRTETEHDVIVIGGGAAGIAAASRLNANGVDFLLLEAEPSLGGRIKSVHFGQSKVDLGAEWAYGETGNIVYETMKDHGLMHQPNNRYKIFLSDREDVSEDFSNNMMYLFNHTYKAGGNTEITDEVAADYYIKTYTKVIKEHYANDEKKIKLAMQMLPMMEIYASSWESTFSWQLPSAHSDWRACPGDNYMHWNGKGYITLLEYLMKDINTTGRMLTDRVVTKIQMAQDGVVVKGEEFTFKGKYVIFTPSLGVLKNHHSDLFDPQLSEAKVKAIEQLGYGAIQKVWLHFPERWWPESDFPGISLAWTWEDLYTLKTQFPKGPNHDGKSFLSNLFGVYPTIQNPNVFTAWFAGSFVPAIEQMTDDLLIEGIMFALEKSVGHLYQLTKPDKILREKWYANEHFHGTYSYQTVESRQGAGANVVLGEPIRSSDNHDRVLFAGEATHKHFYATVHGAVETGYREADRIIEDLKTNHV